MPPLAHAMGFIDGEQGYINARQHVGKAGRRYAFGRHIEQIEFAAPQLPAHFSGFVSAQR